jgi:hypothetical protein
MFPVLVRSRDRRILHRRNLPVHVNERLQQRADDLPAAAVVPPDPTALGRAAFADGVGRSVQTQPDFPNGNRDSGKANDVLLRAMTQRRRIDSGRSRTARTRPVMRAP